MWNSQDQYQLGRDAVHTHTFLSVHKIIRRYIKSSEACPSAGARSREIKQRQGQTKRISDDLSNIGDLQFRSSRVPDTRATITVREPHPNPRSTSLKSVTKSSSQHSRRRAQDQQYGLEYPVHKSASSGAWKVQDHHGKTG